MRRFCFCLVVLALFSCTRVDERDLAVRDYPVAEDAVPDPVPRPMTVPPAAILRAGEFPLWFQFTDEGPLHIERIEDAIYSAALIPWPHAAHARFTLARNGDFLMAVNRYGFVRMSPWHEPGQAPLRNSGRSSRGVGMYNVPGGELWRLYTVGAFVRPGPDGNPMALLYRNNWFLDQGIPPPPHSLWTFDEYSASPRAVSIPPLDAFAPEEGWDLDVLRKGGSGYWYYRASRRNAAQQEIVMLRTDSLEREGDRTTLSDFHNAARPEPLSAAPSSLREMLAVVLARGDFGSAIVVSPGFQSYRRFAAGSGGSPVHVFYSTTGVPGGAFLLATDPEGSAVYVSGTSRAGRGFSLPALPEGFVYTGIGMARDTVFATWEEQVGFSIGAAGFVAIRPVELE